MYKSNLLDLIAAKKIVGGGSGSGGGDKVLGSDGIIKQEHLPDGYPYENKTYVLPETQINNASYTTLTIPENFLTEETVGTIYGVEWNGTPYTVECYKMDMGEGAYIYTLHEPNVFQLVSYASVSGKLYIEAQDGSTEATLSIYQGGVETIDEKYLPDSVKTLGVDGKIKTELIPDDILGDKVLGADGIIKQEHLPEGYPYRTPSYILNPTEVNVSSGGANINETVYSNLAVGETYKVSWNGVEYDCVAEYRKMVTYDDEQIVLEKTGVFLLRAINPDRFPAPKFVVHPQDGSTSVTFSIRASEGGETITKLAEEYLPDSAKVLNSDGIIKQEHLPEGYPYEGEGYALPETALSDPEGTGEFVVFDPINLTAGETYTVNWNGTDYSCETIAADMGGVPAILFGDMGAFDGEPSGSHPFAAMVFPADMIAAIGAGAVFTPLDGSTTVTVSIKGNILKKIDKKFLPFSVARLTQDLDTQEVICTNMSYEDAAKIMLSGTPLIAILTVGFEGAYGGTWLFNQVEHYAENQYISLIGEFVNKTGSYKWSADGIVENT